MVRLLPPIAPVYNSANHLCNVDTLHIIVAMYSKCVFVFSYIRKYSCTLSNRVDTEHRLRTSE